MRFDFNKIVNIKDEEERIDNIKAIAKRCAHDDPIYLSDLIVQQNGPGTDVMVALSEIDKENIDAQDPPQLWIIKVLRDEWGNEPSPGDIVSRTIPINRKNRKSQPVRADEFNAAMTDGSFSERFEKVRKYKVDDKGCISCPRGDAVYFLSNYGIHGHTGYALPHGKSEHSAEVAKAPDGNELHIWYWRYKEVDRHQYSQLKKIKTSTEPKRGHAPSDGATS